MTESLTIPFISLHNVPAIHGLNIWFHNSFFFLS